MATRAHFPATAFDGFHCTVADLARAPEATPHRPAFYEGAFDPAGRIDIHLVTWHELAERAVVVPGEVPQIYTDHAALFELARNNLDTYWRGARQLEAAGVESVGEQDDAIA